MKPSKKEGRPKPTPGCRAEEEEEMTELLNNQLKKKVRLPL
jgi:hypothetical protein